MSSPADLIQDPPRFRITGSTPPRALIPSFSFVSYDVGWTEDEALETLENMKKNMPPGTSLVLQATRDRWENIKSGYVPVPRPIKDSPQA